MKKFLIVGSENTLYGLSLVLYTEGITFLRSLAERGSEVTLLRIEEVDESFHLSEGTRLFFASPPLTGCKVAKRFSERAFKVFCRSSVRSPRGILEFRKVPVFKTTIELLNSFQLSKIIIPLKSVTEFDFLEEAEILADIEVEGKTYPAIILKNGHFLTAFDIGESLLCLLTENYFEEVEKNELPSIANFIYKVAPYTVRLLIYRNYLKFLHKELSQSPYFTTKAPIDPAGWALSQILINALDYSCDFIPRIGKWPSTYTYTACLTHDIEPRKFAYYRGLPKLVETLREFNIKSTFSIVAEPPFPLPESSLKKLVNEGHEIISHGLYHNGSFSKLGRREREYQVRVSRNKLKRASRAEVNGFRAPWLQRTDDLAGILEKQGFLFDSSFVDVDTSLKRGWHGKGISFNFPFKLFSIRENYREYEVVELPLTGPQDMEPFFAGWDIKHCKDIFKQKHEWIKKIGGLCVFLIHAGVFGEKDLKKRLELLHYLHSLLKNENVWITKLSQVAHWWLQRKNLSISTGDVAYPDELSFAIENRGEKMAFDFSVEIPDRFRINKVLIGNKRARAIKGKGRVLIPIVKLGAGERRDIRLFGELA